MKYTPGPWYAREMFSGKWDVASEETGLTVARAETSRDANLIAAAPDMYDVLKKWKKFMMDNYKPEDITWWDETMQAINKAEGK